MPRGTLEWSPSQPYLPVGPSFSPPKGVSCLSPIPGSITQWIVSILSLPHWHGWGFPGAQEASPRAPIFESSLLPPACPWVLCTRAPYELLILVADFIFLSSADGDCCHEIKRHLLLGRKAMTNLDSILKSRDITLSTKVLIVKAMVFSVVMYGCERWTIKKAECWRTDALKLWC